MSGIIVLPLLLSRMLPEIVDILYSHLLSSFYLLAKVADVRMCAFDYRMEWGERERVWNESVRAARDATRNVCQSLNAIFSGCMLYTVQLGVVPSLAIVCLPLIVSLCTFYRFFFLHFCALIYIFASHFSFCWSNDDLSIFRGCEQNIFLSVCVCSWF